MSLESSKIAATPWDVSATPRLPLLAAFVFVILGFAALCTDLPVARYFLAHDLPDEIQRVLNWSEVLAHGTGVAIVALVLFTLDPSNRRQIPRLLTAAYGAGLTVNGLKLLVVRYRPRFFDFEGGVADTFAGWLPFINPINGTDRFGSGIQSFPSGHAAVAVALAFGLSRIYPRGKILFAVLTLFAAVQRVAAADHFVSDTLVGAAVGALLYWVLMQPFGLGQWLMRLEAEKPLPRNEIAPSNDCWQEGPSHDHPISSKRSQLRAG